MRIAFFSTQAYDQAYFDQENQGGPHELVYFQPRLTWDTRALAHGFEAVCAFVNDRLDAKLIHHLADGGLKIIGLRCAGFNNVDLDAAKSRGVQVVRVPAYSPYAVAEHAVALILTLNRKTHKAYNRVREGNFALDRLDGFDLRGRTVGVIGTGKIGRVFATIMKGFGCHVIAHDPYPHAEIEAMQIPYVSLEALLQQSHIVSLHCPLTPDTRHMIDADALSLMKPESMLINTSRGGLIDTGAVIQTLKHRKLGYLGIDVYEQEENLFFQDLSEMVIEDDTIGRLMSFPNVLITAHQAFFTREALTQIAKTTLDSFTAFESDQPLDHAL